MSWAETMKAMALAALAERTSTPASVSVDAPSGWNPHEVWLTRINQPRVLAPREPGKIFYAADSRSTSQPGNTSTAG
jgi:hypothetical protein